MQNLTNFMQSYFNGLILRPPLFYSSEFGLRFEISMPGEEHINKENLKQIKERTTSLFDHVFHDSDDILLITDVNTVEEDRFLEKRPTKVYQKYIRHKDTLYKLQYKLLPWVFQHVDDEEDDNMVTHRFILPCQKRDIRYQQLLMAISYEDFTHPTQLLKGFQHAGLEIYFVNVTRKIIYHLYDDRGCDIIASDKEDIRSLYNDRNDWILDYDRQRIENMMNAQ
ncbi:DUF3885 domain-containing protein [Rossellomorea aquimaris]|uniref:DUF3885 domain-containing protein n=1 Tax=Rossellomorea aquimaris TaxID=189382 RepID=UPI001CD5EBB7|nr:DUF3885 domain-containing protein [Rossellomorea aquimaris]MCA1060153.1 DUF3885 domain-containing protein [Rossellomorea aquimaris]